MAGAELANVELISGEIHHKIVLAGDDSVGKARLIDGIKLVMQDKVVGSTDDTVTINERGELFQIFVAGQPARYQVLGDWYFKKADVIAIIYDVTDTKSYASVLFWLNKAISCAGQTVQMILLGTKTDLAAEQMIATNAAAKFARNHGLFFLETSAYTRSGVESAISLLLEKALLHTNHRNTVSGNLKIQSAPSVADFQNPKFCHF